MVRCYLPESISASCLPDEAMLAANVRKCRSQSGPLSLVRSEADLHVYGAQFGLGPSPGA